MVAEKRLGQQPEALFVTFLRMRYASSELGRSEERQLLLTKPKERVTAAACPPKRSAGQHRVKRGHSRFG